MGFDPVRWDPPAEAGEPKATEWDAGGGDTSRGCLKPIGIGCLVFIALIFLAGQVVGNIQVAPGPVAVAAQVRTAVRSVVLTPSAATLTGRVKVAYDTLGESHSGFDAGLSLGLPEYQAQNPTAGPSNPTVSSPTASGTTAPPAGTPGALFTDPQVRLRVTGEASPATCAGPCEIKFRMDSCQSACVMEFEFSLQLIADGDADSVHAVLTAAAGAPPGSTLPTGLTVEVTVDATPASTRG